MLKYDKIVCKQYSIMLISDIKSIMKLDFKLLFLGVN